MATNKTNNICKIGTASGLVYVPHDKRGIPNTMIQVIITDRNCVVDIDSKFEVVTSGFKNYFLTINQTYFHKPSFDNLNHC